MMIFGPTTLYKRLPWVYLHANMLWEGLSHVGRARAQGDVGNEETEA